MFTAPFTKLSLFALLTASLTLAPSIAQADVFSPSATNYHSTSGTTRLILMKGEGSNAGKWLIDYQTQVNGETWSGSAQSTKVLGHDGNRNIGGTFKDFAGKSGIPPYDGTVERSCTGDFTVIQTAPADRYQLKMIWTVTGGKNCGSIGKTFNIDLSETLPIADANGDFQIQNTATWGGLNSGQNDFHTWDRWQVVDDRLNCRKRPNGEIVSTYRRGDRFESRYDGRGMASAILGADNTEISPSVLFSGKIKGAPWMMTSDGCYVRSNRKYIQPLSFSQPFKP
jgi:hypothetical protein